MAYCVQADIEKRIQYGAITALTDNTHSHTAATVVSALIEDAEAVINGYLAARYTVPFTTVPAAIKTAAIVLTCYYIMMRSASESDEVKLWRDRANDTLAWLQKVGDGGATIPGVDGDGYGGVVTNFDDLEQRFTDDTRDGGKVFDTFCNIPARGAND